MSADWLRRDNVAITTNSLTIQTSSEEEDPHFN